MRGIWPVASVSILLCAAAAAFCDVAPPRMQGNAIRPASLYVEPVDARFRREYALDAFYVKRVSGSDVAVVGSGKVSDWALLEAACMVACQLRQSPRWVREVLATNRVRVAVMAVTEYTMDLPENRDLADGAYEDERSRGLGGMPCCSCGEENLLNLRGDPYGTDSDIGGENILIHEFAHTVAMAIAVGQGEDGRFMARLEAGFRVATDVDGWLERFNRDRSDDDPVYAGTAAHEYWAEGAQAWFDPKKSS